jgi:hypothetical protein
MKLEVGKRYVRRDGKISGLLESCNDASYLFHDKTIFATYTEEGTRGLGPDHWSDLISEYVEPAVEPAKPEWPKYYTTTDQVSFAYVVRHSDESYDLINKDGSTCREGYSWGSRDGRCRTELTFEQTQALLDKPVVVSEVPNDCIVGTPPLIRTFESGATRNLDDNKLDYEGFLSPAVLHAFAEYMHGKRMQADGTMRSSSNWKKGIPIEQYMKSMFRHFMDVWMLHSGEVPIQPETGKPVDYDEAFGGLLFNVMGMWHEIMKARKS